jgi:two-component system sensor histidine kinase DegS
VRSAAGRPARAAANAAADASRNAAANVEGEEAARSLVEEAQAAVSASANTVRDVRARFRDAHTVQLERWQKLHKKLDRAASRNGQPSETLRRDEALAGREVGKERGTLGRIDLAIRSLENAWLFLNREDASLVADPVEPASAAETQMRIIEAQEAERSRLAREVHDGPAQALANGIFQACSIATRCSLEPSSGSCATS